MDWPTTQFPQNTYAYSEPIVIKSWSSGKITAKVGYVTKHPERNIICLEKIWKSKSGSEVQKYNIKKGDWQNIKLTIERLLPEIGDMPTAEKIDESVQKLTQESQLLEFLAKYPSLLRQLPEDLDILALPSDQKEALSRFLSTGGEIAQSVMAKLSTQPITDLEQFSKLLDSLKLSTINSLVTHITGRLNFIELFEKVIHDDTLLRASWIRISA